VNCQQPIDSVRLLDENDVDWTVVNEAFVPDDTSDGTTALAVTSLVNGGLAYGAVSWTELGSYYEASATARLNYQFELTGPANVMVPLIISFSNTVSIPFGGEGESFSTVTLANGTEYTNIACAGSNICYYVYSPGNYPDVFSTWDTSVQSDTISDVDLYVYISTYYIGGSDAEATADPIITIDPSFADAGEFTLAESNGVSNEIPEPPSLALMLSGMCAAAGVLLSRKR
jgi:hypothetical protein